MCMLGFVKLSLFEVCSSSWRYALQVDVIISWVWRSCEVLSEDHLKCHCIQNMNMLVVITCDHWKFSIEWAEHIHVQVWSAFEVNQKKMNIKGCILMYRDIYWSCNRLSLWTNIEEVARRFNVHEILACWARATVEVFLLIYFKVFESFRWFEDFVTWCSSCATRCFAFYILSFNFFIIATTVGLRGYKLFIVDLICGIYSDRLDRFVWQEMTKRPTY